MSKLNATFDIERGWPDSALVRDFMPKPGVTLSQGDIVKVNTLQLPAAKANKVISDADQSGTPPAMVAADKGKCYIVNNWGVGYNNGDLVEWSGTAWVVIVTRNTTYTTLTAAKAIKMTDDSLTSPPGAPVAGDSYVVRGLGGAWSTFALGDTVEWSGTVWVKVLDAQTGYTDLSPAAVLRILDDSLVTDAAIVGTAVAGDTYQVAGLGGGWGAGGIAIGDIVEWTGAAWSISLANVAGEPPDGTRAVVTAGTAAGSFAGNEETVMVYATAGSVWTVANTPAARERIPITNAASLYNGQTFIYIGTHPAGSWESFTGEAPDGTRVVVAAVPPVTGSFTTHAEKVMAYSAATYAWTVADTPANKERILINGVGGFYVGETHMYFGAHPAGAWIPFVGEVPDATRFVVTGATAAGSFAGNEETVMAYDSATMAWAVANTPNTRERILIDVAAGLYAGEYFMYIGAHPAGAWSLHRGEVPNATRIVIAGASAAGDFTGLENKVLTYNAATTAWLTTTTPAAYNRIQIDATASVYYLKQFTYDATTGWGMRTTKTASLDSHVEKATSGIKASSAEDHLWIVVQGNDEGDGSVANKVTCMKLNTGLVITLPSTIANTLTIGDWVYANAGVLTKNAAGGGMLWSVGQVIYSNATAGSAGIIQIAS